MLAFDLNLICLQESSKTTKSKQLVYKHIRTDIQLWQPKHDRLHQNQLLLTVMNLVLNTGLLEEVVPTRSQHKQNKFDRFRPAFNDVSAFNAKLLTNECKVNPFCSMLSTNYCPLIQKRKRIAHLQRNSIYHNRLPMINQFFFNVFHTLDSLFHCLVCQLWCEFSIPSPNHVCPNFSKKQKCKAISIRPKGHELIKTSQPQRELNREPFAVQLLLNRFSALMMQATCANREIGRARALPISACSISSGDSSSTND